MTDPVELDARGLLCPLPVLKTARRLRAMPEGAVLRVLTDDPAAVIDMPHFCAEAGHVVEDQCETGDVTCWTLRRGS